MWLCRDRVGSSFIPNKVTSHSAFTWTSGKKVMADARRSVLQLQKLHIQALSFVSVACKHDWAVSMPVLSILSPSQCLVLSVVPFSLIRLFTTLDSFYSFRFMGFFIFLIQFIPTFFFRLVVWTRFLLLTYWFVFVPIYFLGVW